METGILERWRRMYYPRDECSVADRAAAEAASLTDSQGAFLLLALCVALAALLLIAEITFHRALHLYRKHYATRSESKFYL